MVDASPKEIADTLEQIESFYFEDALTTAAHRLAVGEMIARWRRAAVAAPK